MKSKVDIAIEKAFEALQYAVEHTDDTKEIIILQGAMLELKPFYKAPWAAYNEERRHYWIDAMDAHFDERFDELTEEEVEKMTDWLYWWDEDNDDAISDALYGAARDCGLVDKVYGEE